MLYFAAKPVVIKPSRAIYAVYMLRPVNLRKIAKTPCGAVMKETEILFERRPPLAVLTLNRPQFHTALTWAMYEHIVQNCAAVESDAEIRVMSVRGAGDKAFASGTDISQCNEVRNAEDGLAYEARIERAVGALEALSKPTIAAIEGYAVGGGAALALVCDL